MSQTLFEDLLSCMLTGDPNAEDHYVVSERDLLTPLSVMERGRGKKILFEAGVVEGLAEKALKYQQDYDDVNQVLRNLREDLNGDDEHEASYALLQECRTTLTTVSEIVKSVALANQTVSPERVAELIQLLDDVSQRLPVE